MPRAYWRPRKISSSSRSRRMTVAITGPTAASVIARMAIPITSATSV